MLKKAVFLDRDGVLNVEKGYIRCVQDLEVFPYSRECIKKIHQKGYYAIVVTNQSGIARGYYSEEVLKAMNEKLVFETDIDAIYYCPHHPEGIIEEYAISCNCRKPKTGMIERACKDYPIDIRKSYIVGDRASDIMMGESIGLTTVLLESGYGTSRLEIPVNPDYIFMDLKEFVENCI